MHNEEWSGAGVAAALARLEDAGYPQSKIARLTGVSQSTINRWGRGVVRPGYDPVRRLAVAVWRQHPDIARELTEAAGYIWAEPDETEAPPPTPLEELLGLDGAEDFRRKMRAKKGVHAAYYLSGLEDVLSTPPADADDCPEPGASRARRAR